MKQFEILEEEFKEYEFKIIDFHTVSDDFYSYNIYKIEFLIDIQYDVFGTIMEKTYIENIIKIKHGNNIKRSFQRMLVNYLDES